ncbi:MAG: hypothetical protein H7Y59_00340 [Anaerolineales bacterium]|nr:hypothetical protein [Anaerolineales bacterium]
MTTVTRNQRIYFAAVGALALWVAFWGLLIPELVDKAIPWLVPPFHARFIGAIYLSAVVIMGSAMMARYYDEVRVVTIMVSIWTGALFIISLFYLSEFDFSRGPVLFWFAAYIAYPIIGFWIAWTQRNTSNESKSPSLPNWIRNYFLLQGALLTILSLILFLAPDFMITLWPWKITRMLAQIYSGPFLSFGIGSLMLSRQQTWPQVRIGAWGIFVLALGVLVVSAIHRSLFTLSSPSALVWFGGFLLVAIILGAAIIRSRKQAGG